MASTASYVRDPLTRMELELQQWAAWVRSGVGVAGYASTLGNLRGSTVPTPQILDSRALEIDGAMQRLKRFDLRLHTALWCHFVEGAKPRTWCKKAGVSATTAYSSTLPSALRWMVSEVGLGGA